MSQTITIWDCGHPEHNNSEGCPDPECWRFQERAAKMKSPIYVGFSRSKYFVALRGEPVRAWKKTLSGAVRYAERLIAANPETYSRVVLNNTRTAL